MKTAKSRFSEHSGNSGYTAILNFPGTLEALQSQKFQGILARRQIHAFERIWGEQLIQDFQ